MEKKVITHNKSFGIHHQDLFYYLLLFCLLGSAYVLFYLVSYSKMLQFGVGVLSAVMYVLWGVVHHYRKHDLYFANVVEYIFIAILALVILAGILL